MGKFGPKKSVISFAWKLTDMVSVGCWFLFQHYFSEFATLNPFLGKFGSKRSKLSILTENWHTEYLEDADSYSVISFLNFLPEIYFWANLGWKSQSSLFCLKINMQSISRMLILIATLVVWISNPQSFFGQIWAEKDKAVSFARKLVHTVSRGCWFLFWY